MLNPVDVHNSHQVFVMLLSLFNLRVFYL